MAKKKNLELQLRNSIIFQTLMNRLLDLAMSRFQWENLPDNIDKRFVEYSLIKYGTLVFFEDDVLGYQFMTYTFNGGFSAYGNPEKINVYSPYNAYTAYPDRFVLCWDNMLRTTPLLTLEYYAMRITKTIISCDINVDAQKTPILLSAEEKNRYSIEEAYRQYEGGAPVIFTTKGIDLPDNLKVFSTQAPFVAQDLMVLYNAIWNEALTYLGIPNVSYVSGSRKVADEVLRSQGGTIASRYSPQMMREQACEAVNKMFGLNVNVTFRADFDDMYMHMPIEGGQHFNEERSAATGVGGGE